jgi:hypothetical protein
MPDFSEILDHLSQLDFFSEKKNKNKKTKQLSYNDLKFCTQDVCPDGTLLFKNYKKPQQSYLNVKRNF